MSSKAHPGLNRFAEVCALLMKQPRTPKELGQALGTSNPDQPYRYINALRGEGLLYVAGWKPASNGRLAQVFAWQPSVCEREDMPKPKGEGA